MKEYDWATKEELKQMYDMHIEKAHEIEIEMQMRDEQDLIKEEKRELELREIYRHQD